MTVLVTMFRRLSIVFFALVALVVTAQAADRAIIVLDASGSMWAQIDGEAKMTIARRVLGDVMKTVPPSLELGLMAYGHREKASCDDIELIVPPGPNATTGPQIVAAANALMPKGKTPLSAAVKQAAEALRYTEDKATVILITDGIETCDADPCALGTALKQAGVDLTVHVVGLGLSQEEGAEVACLARNTGGKYFSATNAAKLGAALTETVAETVAPPPTEPVPAPAQAAPPAKVEKTLRAVARLSANSDIFRGPGALRFDVHKANADGSAADETITTSYSGSTADDDPQFALPAGRYVVVASRDLAKAEAIVDVTEDRQTTVDIPLNAGIIIARGMATETVPVTDGNMRFDVLGPSGETQTSYDTVDTLVVAAGKASVTGKLGSAIATVPVAVKAGETSDIDVVLGAGKLVLHGKRTAEAKEFDGGIRWDVTSASGETLTNYGGETSFDLPSGDYTMKAILGEATLVLPVSIEAGKTLDKVVIVATGRIVAHALFAEGGPVVERARFDVLAAEKGEDGQRRIIATSYDDGATFDLPPGQYILSARSDIAAAQSAIEVKAGPPVEVPVIMDAGLLAVTAPGADRLVIVSEKKDIYGKQAELATSYDKTWQLALPAGSYVVRARKAGGDTEVTGTALIKAGERTELTIP